MISIRSILKLRAFPEQRALSPCVSECLRQGCQIFLGPNIPKWEKYTKWQKTIHNDHKLYQKGSKLFRMVIKYTCIFHTLRNLPKLGFLVWKQTIWQPWSPSVIVSGSGHRWQKSRKLDIRKFQRVRKQKNASTVPTQALC
jgi:hypothetical protein